MGRLQKFVLTGGVVVVGLMAAVPGFAQQPPGGPGAGADPKAMLERQMSVLTERLALTPEQQPKVKAILEETIRKNREIREKYRPEPGTPPAPEMREEVVKVRTETRTKLSEVLTADQMKAYDKWDQERRQPRGPGGPGGPGN